MNLEEKRQAAIDFFIATANGRGNPALRSVDFRIWNPQIGELTAEELGVVSAKAMDLFKDGLAITIDGTTAEGNRVAIEARSSGELINGTRYNGTYHILIEFDDAGKVRRMAEHLDSKHMADVVSPLLGVA